MFVPAAAVPIFIFSTLNFRKKHEISLPPAPHRRRIRFAFNIIVAHLWGMKTPAIAVSNPHFHIYVNVCIDGGDAGCWCSRWHERNMLDYIDATVSVYFVNAKICSLTPILITDGTFCKPLLFTTPFRIRIK